MLFEFMTLLQICYILIIENKSENEKVKVNKVKN